MNRIAVCALFAVAACYGDMISQQDNVAGFEGTPIDPSLELPCAEAVEPASDGVHYPGNACLGCHNGSLGPTFTVAGTLYADPDGAMALPGMNIRIIDATDSRIDLISAANGNFYTDVPVTLPATVYVAACPDVVPMPIELTLGDCNSCHSAGKRTAFSP